MATTRRPRSQGKRRPGLPQRKDAPAYTAGERSRDHGTGGRFTKGNRAGANRAVKQIIRKHLGPGAGSAEVEALYQDTRKLYAALLTDLPANDAAEVQDLIARRARWSVLSARFAAKAAEAGLFDEKAQKLLETALKLDQRAERLAVTARDEAERLREARERAGGSDLFQQQQEFQRRLAEQQREQST